MLDYSNRMSYILSLDQGTTSSRALLFDSEGSIISAAQKEITQYYPKPGWVEHDALEIWNTQYQVALECISQGKIDKKDIKAIGVTNQRETIVAWSKSSGAPLYKAIVWQDRRTTDICQELKSKGTEKSIYLKTGLLLDPYFSATKVQWLLENVPEIKEALINNDLMCGTRDSWLIWCLSGQSAHLCDTSNASRTLLFNLDVGKWDQELLSIFKIPIEILPEIKPSSGYYELAKVDGLEGIPISGIAGDQHAALFGQMCTEPGTIKNTYGTGCFILMNIGDVPKISDNKLLTTIACSSANAKQYAFEGSIFTAGAAIKWLVDNMQVVDSITQIESLANSVPDSGGVYFVPAFAGLGAPHWDPKARGAIIGLTGGSTKAHIARATIESLAFQTFDVIDAMEKDAKISVKELKVDGGATVNDLLLQFQSDILDVPVLRPKIMEITALGAAYLAGLGVGFWQDINELKDQWKIDKKFEPSMKKNVRDSLLDGWHTAINRVKNTKNG
jgi:glycerol kinase